MHNITEDVRKSVERLIESCTSAVLTTIDENGFPHTRAMLPPRKKEGLECYYFTTNTSSQKVAHLRKNHKACIYFYNAETFVGAMFIGTMEVLEDAASKQIIWRIGDEMYYSKGVTDPDYCVVKFTALSLRYYSNFNPVSFMLGDK